MGVIYKIENVVSQEDVSYITANITVKNFENIKASKLLISFDPEIIDIVEIIKNSELSGNLLSTLTVPPTATEYQTYKGSVILSWFCASFETLIDNDVLATLKIKKIKNGVSKLNFDNTFVYNCRTFGNEYANLAGTPLNSISKELPDTPYENHYINGQIEFIEFNTAVVKPSLPEFPINAKIAQKKDILKYVSNQIVAKKCENCARKTGNKCSIGNFVIAKTGICEWYSSI